MCYEIDHKFTACHSQHAFHPYKPDFKNHGERMYPYDNRGVRWHKLINRRSFMPPFHLLSFLMGQGPKTVFFWAPAFKWGLVIAGIGDLQRPVEQLSIAQSASLAATGVIWSRYSLVIIPKNYSLFSVNVFVAATQIYQLYRAITYHRNLQEKATK